MTTQENIKFIQSYDAQNLKSLDPTLLDFYTDFKADTKNFKDLSDFNEIPLMQETLKEWVETVKLIEGKKVVKTSSNKNTTEKVPFDIPGYLEVIPSNRLVPKTAKKVPSIEDQIGTLYYIRSKLDNSKNANIYRSKSNKGYDAQNSYLLNLRNYVDNAIKNNELPMIFAKEIYYQLEQNNSHTLNNALELLGYFGQDEKVRAIMSRDSSLLSGFEPLFPMVIFPESKLIAQNKLSSPLKPRPNKNSKDPFPSITKKETLLAEKQTELKQLKETVIANSKFKEKLAEELAKHLKSTGLGESKQEAFSKLSLDEKIAFITKQIKFYKNLIKGDKADFKAIGKKIGYSYTISKPRSKSKFVAQAEKVVNQEIKIDGNLVIGRPKVLFDPSTEFERYNGGWTKSISGLDKSQTNGYSIEGEFKKRDGKDYYTVGKLYLDCGIGGSRKNQRSYYKVFVLDENAKVEIISESTGKSWATDLWSDIEKYSKQNNLELNIKNVGLGSKPKPKNRTAKKPKTFWQKIGSWWNS